MTASGFNLRGKVAIVTGGNGGIGLGMARGLADAGADIAVIGRNKPNPTQRQPISQRAAFAPSRSALT